MKIGKIGQKFVRKVPLAVTSALLNPEVWESNENCD
jgi:hypothetical protein